MGHPLDPLLRPKSIALMGASPRAGSVGALTLQNLMRGGFAGDIYPINPRYDDIEGLTCYGALSELPGAVDHVYIGLGNNRLEAALDEVIASGAKAVTIISTTVLAEDIDPPLTERVTSKVREAGLLCCGGNGMGFYNFNDNVWLTGFQTRDHAPHGNIALISQSGAGMCGLVDVEARLDFSLAVSTGQELTVTLDQYLDFALETDATRAVGLFVETFRNPEGTIAAFEKAKAKGIPLVAVKVGRTAFAAEMALSHSGALVGADGTYEALFDRYGIQRAQDLDELADTLIAHAQGGAIGDGGLVSLHDSGGERQLMIDLADEIGVPLTKLSEGTVAALEPLLDPGLPAVNPLDNWADGGDDFDDKAAEMFALMLEDEGAALGVVNQARIAESGIYQGYLDYIARGQARTGKPVFLVSGRQGSGADPLAVQATRRGLAVLDGTAGFLRAARHLLAYRDFKLRPSGDMPKVDADIAAKWRKRLQEVTSVPEDMGAALLQDFGIAAPAYHRCQTLADAVAAASTIDGPVVMKTAAPEIHHKSDVGGVALNLQTEELVAEAYQDMAARLGPEVLVTEMIDQKGVELLLGATLDEGFGPIVTLGFGGIYVEAFGDVKHLLPPFAASDAKRRLDQLKLRPLLDTARGRAAVNIDAFCELAARFSAMVKALEDVIAEIDINPVLVSDKGAMALDCLIIPRARVPS